MIRSLTGTVQIKKQKILQIYEQGQETFNQYSAVYCSIVDRLKAAETSKSKLFGDGNFTQWDMICDEDDKPSWAKALWEDYISEEEFHFVIGLLKSLLCVPKNLYEDWVDDTVMVTFGDLEILQDAIERREKVAELAAKLDAKM